MKKILALVLILLFFGISFSFAEDRTITVKAKKFSYTPNKIEVNKGDHVTIRLMSEDVTHGLFIDGYGLNTKAHPGSDGSISFVANKTGKYAFRCSVTCGEFHPYMVGNLIVGPNHRFYFFGLIILVICIGSAAIPLLKRKS
tara:strand:- start:1738 stop:2163 length:426 start_codon:yes stop_codon:yes gene_type:complete